MKIAVCTALILFTIATSTNARSSPAFRPDIPSPNFVSNVPIIESFRGRVIAPEQAAREFVQGKLGLAVADLVVKNIVPSDATGVTSVYLRQKVNGIEVVNADINVNVNKYVPIVTM